LISLKPLEFSSRERPLVADAEDVGAILILDADQLVGVITDRDIIVRAIAKGKDPRGMSTREISSGELVTVGPDQDLSALQYVCSPASPEAGLHVEWLDYGR
jgi:CBS domain-containing protein